MDPQIKPVQIEPVSERKTGDERQPKRLSEYQVGDTIPSGDKIAWIYYSNSRFIICKTSTGGLAYKTAFQSPTIQEIEIELSKCHSMARRQLRGAYRDDYQSVVAACLSSALQGLDDEAASHFEPARSFIEERGPIEYVYGVGDSFIVYRSKNNLVAYECDNLPSRLITAVAEFTRLQNIANCSLDAVDKTEVLSILGSDLVSALRSPEESDPKSYFLSSKEFITNRSEAVLRSRYVLSSVSSSVGFLIILILVTFLMKRNSMSSWIVMLGSVGGIVGATISIIQRGVKLTVNPFVPISHVVLQGIVRVVLGAVFGALLVVASNAGIALGILAGNTWSLFILSVVAGFSERFIPDILDQLASDRNTRAEAKT